MEHLLASCSHIESMRAINSEIIGFDNYNVIENFSRLFDELPHSDTISNYLKEVSVGELKKVMTNMVKTLIKKEFLRIIEETISTIISSLMQVSYTVQV